MSKLPPSTVHQPTQPPEANGFNLGEYLSKVVREIEASSNEIDNKLRNATGNTKRYNQNQKQVMDSFLASLEENKTYKTLLQRVPNPNLLGDPKVPLVLVALAGHVDSKKKALANILLVNWFKDYKMKRPDKETGCPYYSPVTQNMHLRIFFGAVHNLHSWVLKEGDLDRFPGSLGAVMKELYNERAKKYKGFGERKACRIKPSDFSKIKLGKFDENDLKQHQLKILVGCGIYFGFRGIEEHAYLTNDMIIQGKFEIGHAFEEYDFVGIGSMMIDKSNQLSRTQSYKRDTSNLMRMPILDNDPTSDDFGGSFVRLLNKVMRNKENLAKKNRFYLRPKKDGKEFMSAVIGHNTIREMMKDAAEILGIDQKDFKGGQAWRALFITTMVNDSRVSTAEAMKSARHNSVAANKNYQATDIVSEGKKQQCLLENFTGKTGLESKTQPVPSSSSSSKLQLSASTNSENNNNNNNLFSTNNKENAIDIDQFYPSTQEEKNALDGELDEFEDLKKQEAFEATRSRFSELTSSPPKLSERHQEVRNMRIILRKKSQELKHKLKKK